MGHKHGNRSEQSAAPKTRKFKPKKDAHKKTWNLVGNGTKEKAKQAIKKWKEKNAGKAKKTHFRTFKNVHAKPEGPRLVYSDKDLQLRVPKKE